MRTITLKLTEKQADALASWIAYLDAGPTDWEESNPSNGILVRRVGDKLAAERVALRRVSKVGEGNGE